MSKKVKFGIVGIGKQGSYYAGMLSRGLVKTAELAAVCDILPERREWAKASLKNVKIYDDYKKMFSDGIIDAVIVCTPHYFHPEITIDAIESGIHTLSDKPAGVFTSAVRRENEVAAKHKDVVFGMMFNQRTNPLYRRAKEIIDSGRLGELKRINWIITDWYRPQAYYDQGGWRGTWWGEGGGVLLNQCPHQIDIFQWLGGMPVKASAIVQYGRNRDISVENDVTASFEYENGATGVFIASTHDSPGTNRLEIDGDKGQIIIEKNTLTFTELTVGETEFNKTNKKFMPKIPKKVHRKKLPLPVALISLGTQHLKIIRNFSQAVLDGTPLTAPGNEGIRGLTISNAIYLSDWLGKAVEIPFDENEFERLLNIKIEEEKKFLK